MEVLRLGLKKKIISLLVLTAFVFSFISAGVLVPQDTAYAADDSLSLVNSVLSKMSQLSATDRDKLVDFFATYYVNGQKTIFNDIWDEFQRAGQTARLESFGLTYKSIEGLNKFLKDSPYTKAELKQKLGQSSIDQNYFETAKLNAFRFMANYNANSTLSAADANNYTKLLTVSTAQDVYNKLLNFDTKMGLALTLYSTLNSDNSHPIIKEDSNGKFIIDDTNFNYWQNIVNGILTNDIQNFTSLKDALTAVLNRVNTNAEFTTLKPAFISFFRAFNLYPQPTNSGGGGTTGGGSTGGGTTPSDGSTGGGTTSPSDTTKVTDAVQDLANLASQLNSGSVNKEQAVTQLTNVLDTLKDVANISSDVKVTLETTLVATLKAFAEVTAPQVNVTGDKAEVTIKDEDIQKLIEAIDTVATKLSANTALQDLKDKVKPAEVTVKLPDTVATKNELSFSLASTNLSLLKNKNLNLVLEAKDKAFVIPPDVITLNANEKLILDVKTLSEANVPKDETLNLLSAPIDIELAKDAAGQKTKAETLNKALTVKLSFDKTKVAVNDTLGVFRLNPTTSKWEKVDATIDLANGKASFNRQSLSTYAVMKVVATQPQPQPVYKKVTSATFVKTYKVEKYQKVHVYINNVYYKTFKADSKGNVKVTVILKTGKNYLAVITVTTPAKVLDRQYLEYVPPVVVKTAKANVNLRATPSYKGKILTVVKKGTKVTVLGSSGSYYKVKYTYKGKTYTGYVYKIYLK